MRIGAHDLLAVGTVVRVGNEQGKVTKADMVPASNGGMIALHTVKFTERWQRALGGRGKFIAKKNPVTRTVNYSFIELV